MEASEIARRNIAIAAYMGWEMATDFHTNATITIDPERRNDYAFWTWNPPFNRDMDLLMPVVEKIMKEKKEGFHLLLSKNGYSCRFGTERNFVGDTMVEAAWMAVSEYVLSRGK